MELVEYLRQAILEEPNRLIASGMRKDLVKAIINSYPEGAVISTKEITNLPGLRAGGITTMLARMVEDGHIAREQSRPGGPARYTVLIPGNTYDREREGAKPSRIYEPRTVRSVIPPHKEIDISEPEEEKAMADPIPAKSYTIDELIKLAMEWEFLTGAKQTNQFLSHLKKG